MTRSTLLVLALVVVGCGPGDAPHVYTNTTRAVAAPAARKLMRMAPLGDRQVAIVGGLTVDGDNDGTYDPAVAIDLWDQDAGAFSAGPALAEPRMWHEAVAHPNGDVLAIGGWAAGDASHPQTIEKIASGSGAVTTVATLGAVRNRPGARIDADGSLLVVGGTHDASTFAARVDLATGASTTLPLTTNLDYHGTCQAQVFPLSGGRYLLAGGAWTDIDFIYCARGLEIVDFAAQSARLVGTDPMNSTARARQVVALGDDNFLLVGSNNDAEGSWLIRFDAATETSTVLASDMGELDEPAAVMLGDGRVLIVGAPTTGFNAATDATWLFDPATDALAAGPPLPAPMVGPLAARVGDGPVLILGYVETDADPAGLIAAIFE